MKYLKKMQIISVTINKPDKRCLGNVTPKVDEPGGFLNLDNRKYLERFLEKVVLLYAPL